MRLEADGIYLKFGLRTILSDIYLRCDTGKITGVLGQNGCGKTCLMSIVYGSMHCVEKSVRYNGKNMPEAYKQTEIATYLPQFQFAPGSLRLKDVLKDFVLSLEEMLLYFPEFKDFSNTNMKHFSGGQRRLVEVYTILMSAAQFSLLDEPFSHIMQIHVERIIELMHEVKSRKGLIITDHLYKPVVTASDSLYVLKDGKLHLTKQESDLASLGYVRGLIF